MNAIIYTFPGFKKLPTKLREQCPGQIAHEMTTEQEQQHEQDLSSAEIIVLPKAFKPRPKKPDNGMPEIDGEISLKDRYIATAQPDTYLGQQVANVLNELEALFPNAPLDIYQKISEKGDWDEILLRNRTTERSALVTYSRNALVKPNAAKKLLAMLTEKAHPLLRFSFVPSGRHYKDSQNEEPIQKSSGK